jgi:hypothetical protein
MQHSPESIFVAEYLREYESIFEIALAHESGVLFDKKKPEVEISWNYPFKQILHLSTPGKFA